MYAIIDIETTGGRPEIDRITEIAIVVHDGKQVIRKYSSLVNPECSIPYHITRITGITNQMVEEAPKFYEIAKEILNCIGDSVFVAHNVRFDYGFVRAAFKNLGYPYSAKTLCTVRLSRKAFPGFSSYSLGNLCENLRIPIQDRHRAMGDAEATAIVFGRICEERPDLLVEKAIKEQIKLSSLPPLLDKSVFDKIPEQKTGVYYFYNVDREVIYIGKGNDIKKRIAQHFSFTAVGSRRAITMKEEIADISFEETGSELVALLLESDEIKKIRPKYNITQKKTRAVPFYGIFANYDIKGFISLTIKRLEEGDQPLITSDSSVLAKEFLYTQIEKFELCLAKCDLHKTGGSCFNRQIHKCKGACADEESPESYNQRALQAIEKFSFKNESFLLIGKGRSVEELSVICVEKGQYKGFGYIDVSIETPNAELMRACIRKYPHNRDIQTILCSYRNQGHQKITLEH